MSTIAEQQARIPAAHRIIDRYLSNYAPDDIPLTMSVFEFYFDHGRNALTDAGYAITEATALAHDYARQQQEMDNDQ